ncbi:MAG: DUF11 domain-containing protein [Anaerolineae bacterium]|nr:DUF11 domain-containing protein [Anaerolineae bacterium]
MLVAGWAIGLQPVAPAQAATGVVGTGAPASCTEAALLAQLNAAPAGGLIVFNCGAAPHTITLTTQITLDATYAATTIDGGGLITLQQTTLGVRVFEVQTSASLTLVNITITGGNVAVDGGGGILVSGGALTLDGATVTGNQAVAGGGIRLTDGSVVIQNGSSVSNNTATGTGGGGGMRMSGPSSTLTITDSTFAGNQALTDGGGGLFRVATAGVTITRSTISGNTSSQQGGGLLFAYGDPVTITNSTVSGNTANNSASSAVVGGGIRAVGTTVNINYSTIAGNSSPLDGGIGRSDGAVVNLHSSIVAGSTGADCSATMTTLDYNIDSDNTCGLTGTNDQPNVDPLLGALQDNGGPTHTHALGASSPAIDTADNTTCPATDQRGVIRPIDGDGNSTVICDIGAYEAPTDIPDADISVSKGVSDTMPDEGQAISYTVTVTNNGPDNATSVTITDQLPTGVTYTGYSATQGTYTSGTGVWNVGALANGADATLTLNATVNTGTGGSTITNTATRTASTPTDLFPSTTATAPPSQSSCRRRTSKSRRP